MKAEDTVRLKVELPCTLHKTLADAAKRANISVEQLATDSIAQVFEVALRHRVLIERQQEIDEALLTIAQFVGALSADSADVMQRQSRPGNEG